MPRQARIDAPGALHHIIIRGIDRRVIFTEDRDRENFLERLSDRLTDSQTACYAWALMSNHAHLLLRTGRGSIASFMQRLLTGYAVSFNKRHRRHGHLFQNRYKSILCEEDRYLRQLVAYIHLNPLRARIVEDVAALRDYPFTGHSALMGRVVRPWQDSQYVMALFGRTVSEARRNLQQHVVQWSEKGRCRELTGGGLIRSAGGWRALKEACRDGIRLTGDERLLGSSEFVEGTLKQAGEQYEHRMRLQSAGIGLEELIGGVCQYFGIEEKELTRPTRRTTIAQVRGLIGHMATQEMSIPGSEVARRFKQDRSTISRAVQRVDNDPELMMAATTIMEQLKHGVKQR
jgi:REP element-mobilizing transposase RayT